MATFAGVLQKPINAGEFNPADGSVNLADYSVPSSRSPLAYASSSVKGGSRSVGGELAAYPVERQGVRESLFSWPRAPRVFQGGVQPSFAKDVFDRIHIIPASIDVGNLTGSISRSVSLWNTYAITKVCSGVVRTHMEGVAADVTGAFPLAGFSSRDVVFVFLMDGPPIIDGSLTFVFADVSIKVTLTGRRIVSWVWLPQADAKEFLEWFTDIIASRDGKEQRSRLRNAPRQSWEYSVFVTDSERQKLNAALYGWQGRTWGLPVWSDQVVIAGPIAAGVSSISLDTTLSDFRTGGMAMIWQSETVNEIVQIDRVFADHLTMILPTTVAFAAGPVLVLPVQSSRIVGEVNRVDHPGDASVYKLTFTSIENIDTVGDPAPVQIDGMDVFTDRVGLADPSTSVEISRPVITLDYGVGPVTYDVPVDFNSGVQSISFVKQTRSSVWALRKWFHRRAGRLVPFWMPSWERDMTLALPIAATDTAIRVKNVGYARLLADNAVRKRIVLILKNGTQIPLLVAGATDSGTEEVLGLSGPVGTDVSLSAIDRISWFALRRLDADRVEFTWHRPGAVSVNVPVREIPQ